MKKEQFKSKGELRGTVRIGAFSPIVKIGDPVANKKEIYDTIVNDKELNQCNIIVTPELSITGYTCQDMFFNEQLLDTAYEQMLDLSRLLPTKMIVVGCPIRKNGKLLNCACTLLDGNIVYMRSKKYLANYNEFYEKRWFDTEDEEDSILNIQFRKNQAAQVISVGLGAEICEDLWSVNPPSNSLALGGAEILVNLSASDEVIGKADFRRELVTMQSAKTISAYVYCSAGMTESTSDVIYGGHNIIAENGKILAESDLFGITNKGKVIADIDIDMLRHDRLQNKTFSCSTHKAKAYNISYRTRFPGTTGTVRTISMTPFVPSDSDGRKSNKCLEIFNIQKNALAVRWNKVGSEHLVLGVSGGLDSTLALLVAVGAADVLGYDRKRIIGVTMPCFGTTSRTKDNAIALMKYLKVTSKEINIGDSVAQHLKDLGLSEDDRSIAYENAQARERTQVLMDYANMIGGFVVGTGDLSELALGWCTYNGDHMSMYNVNASIPKTLVREIVFYAGVSMINKTGCINTKKNKLMQCIMDILYTPVSPELLPPSPDGKIVQLTEDSVGPYVLNDFFLYYHMRYGFEPSKIIELANIAVEQSEYNYTEKEIIEWLLKFYNRFERAQFKRNCCPDCVKVGSVSLNPRGDWRMPTEFSADKNYLERKLQYDY